MGFIDSALAHDVVCPAGTEWLFHGFADAKKNELGGGGDDDEKSFSIGCGVVVTIIVVILLVLLVVEKKRGSSGCGGDGVCAGGACGDDGR